VLPGMAGISTATSMANDGEHADNLEQREAILAASALTASALTAASS